MSLLAELAGNDRTAIEKRERVQRAREDFGYFCREYLSDYFFEDAAEYQKILYRVANSRAFSIADRDELAPFVRDKYRGLLTPQKKLSGIMCIEPREHGKTVRWSFAYVLWCVLTGRARYVLLIGASGESAGEYLGNIKNELEENERLAADFGEMTGTVWTNKRLELSNGTCIQCKGSGSSMRGTRFRQYRPDLIVIDDVLKDDAVGSVSQRDKIHKWLKRVVFNLGKKAFIIWVNTIFHNDDPISRLCRELESGSLVHWAAFRLSCIKEDGTPLWGEYWTLQELEDKKKTIGAAAFSTEYMNEPLSDEERIIQPDWIAAHRYAVLPPVETLRFFCGVDPATGKHDRTAMVSVAVEKATGTIYVLPSWAKTCSETATVSELMLLHSRWHFQLIGWEDVVFSGIYANYVQKLSAEKGVYLPIKKLTVRGMSKEARVRSISMLIENGIIRFPEKGAESLVTELLEFPLGSFDDQCDALVHAVNTIERGAAPVLVSTLGGVKNAVAQSIIRKVRSYR